ncbi:Testis, prostate and placenta-expressed protein [Holothuria leucospilota]|uniref:Testis, prostate and placenta-expressed protein n=1 Tax=Holothuria leucospilota TaxID=206669 RepID=A0A9Q1CBG9_HOLLE|nr:Testis, prostate and placenta-expressed protein [Holothuria leucospilota]
MPTNIEVPDYIHNYPHMNRVMLASVKEGLYHPRLPTFRRMDMDTAAHKLPDEHCRTTTGIGKQDFNNATITHFQPPKTRYSGLNITDTGRSLKDIVKEDVRGLKVDWTKAKEMGGASTLDKKGELRFTGYAVRYLKPSITGTWRYTFRQEPMLDQYGQRPVPANIFSRYRDTFPQYSRNITADAFR